MASQSPTGMYLTIDVHYSGVFARNPLKYLDLEKITVRDVDFGGFSYKEFLLWLRNLTNGRCDNVYYCSRKETLGEGIIRIDSDADYWEFVEATYTPEAELDVYIDQQNDPILDWAENEVLSDGNGYDSEEEDENVEEDDSEEDDNLDGIMAYEHEEDEEVHTFNKTVGDDFLNKLSGKLSDDDEPNDGKDEKVVFPVHDENQAWDKMMPILGMKFATPMQLKLCLTNYAVKNGYDLWYEKSDHNRGQLLAAVGRDANNHIYPLAWAVVAVESKETWKWFVDLLLDDIGMGNGHGLTLISDQHKGLLEAVKERVPAAEHRQCARHICANFMKKFKGQQFSTLFWRAAASTTQAKFEQHMNEIKKIEPLAYDHLMEKDPKTWSKAFFQTDRACDAYENGVSESFNSIIAAARKRPLITMLEEIRIYVMERLCIQKSKGSSWGDLNICPTIRLKLSKIQTLQRFWRVVPSGYQQFEVRLLQDAYAVDLGKKTCGCRGWQLTGYPCVHAYAAISNLNRDPEDYVSPWLTTRMFCNAYLYTIKPLNGSDMWPDVDYIKPLPPKMRRMPGRPSTKRKRDQIENELKGNKHTVSKRGIVMRCSICRESGHNKAKCPQKPIGESSNPKSKLKNKKANKKGKVKVELHQEVDLESDSDSKVQREPDSEVESYEVDLESDSDSEVQREPDSEVESYEVDYEEGNHTYEDVDQLEVEAEEQVEVGGVEEQVELEEHVEALVEVEVEEGEYQAGDVDQVEQVEVEVIQDPVGQDDQGQAAVQDPVEEEHMMEVPAFQVLQGKRRRKPSERITKIQIRKKWEGKEGSSCDKPMELD
ncbi:unnamed protein product [Lactuca saligna]|uniref:SWIM-type domain-containing protein n=1 Tax=Lactuca saligna TaxID=75948 RepID=A0AA35Y526_LACSI|nr:unnamed protein product [Lactuca saligna]CAI9293918.1 unnamed protein product [Lactuca saligna]